MPEEKLKSKKKRLDLTPKPISERESITSESVLDRLLGVSDSSSAKQPDASTPNNPILETNRFVERTGSFNEPVRRDTVSLNEPVRQTKGFPEIKKIGYLKISNEIMDSVLPKLTPFEQTVYLRLYRLSHGFGNVSCTVGITTLTKACNIKETACRAALRRLMDLGLISIIEVRNDKEIKGTTYEVRTGLLNEPVRLTNRSEIDTGSLNEPNKDHDDDLLNKDHHQSAHARATMMIYQSLTGNSWTKADQDAYEKIKEVSTAVIEQGIKLANQRAASRPNSLAYFVKEILNLAHPSKQSKTQRKKALGKIVARVRELHIGQGEYRIADLAADVKNACAREGAVFDNDLFNEIIGAQ